jgi:hypothetical protein
LEQFAGGGDNRLRPIPEEQPPRNRAALDPHRVGVAAAALRGALEDSICPTLLHRGLPHASADGYFWYPPIHYLEAVPEVRLLDAKFMEEMAWGCRGGGDGPAQSSGVGVWRRTIHGDGLWVWRRVVRQRI